MDVNQFYTVLQDRTIALMLMHALQKTCNHTDSTDPSYIEKFSNIMGLLKHPDIKRSLLQKNLDPKMLIHLNPDTKILESSDYWIYLNQLKHGLQVLDPMPIIKCIFSDSDSVFAFEKVIPEDMKKQVKISSRKTAITIKDSKDSVVCLFGTGYGNCHSMLVPKHKKQFIKQWIQQRFNEPLKNGESMFIDTFIYTVYNENETLSQFNDYAVLKKAILLAFNLNYKKIILVDPRNYKHFLFVLLELYSGMSVLEIIKK